MCARRRTYFLLLRQKKVGKEKATLVSASPFAPVGEGGSLWCSGAGRRRGTRFAHYVRCARTSPASQITKQACPAARLPAPHPALLGADTRVGCSRRAIASLGPWCASASHRAPEWLEGARLALAKRGDGLTVARGRATRWPVSLPSGCAWGAQGAGWRACRRTRPHRELICRGCLNGARQRAVSSTAHPAPEHPRLPRSPRGRTGSQTAGSPFFWVLFFGEAKKSTSPAGASPGSGKQ